MADETRRRQAYLTVPEFSRQLERYTKDDYEHPDSGVNGALDAAIAASGRPAIIDGISGEWNVYTPEGYETYPSEAENHSDDDPYWFLLDHVPHIRKRFLKYADALLQDAVDKGCDQCRILSLIHYYGTIYGQMNLPELEPDVLLRGLTIAPQYIVNEDGIFGRYPNNVILHLSPKVILPAAIIRDAASGDENQLVIAYQGDSGTEKIAIDKTVLYSPKGIKNLVKRGIMIDKANIDDMIRFLQSTELLNRRILPVISVYDRLGWTEDYAAFVPYTPGTHYGRMGLYRNEYESVQRSRGSLDDWTGFMRQFRDREHIPERVALAASFASVLVRISRSTTPFMLDIWGAAGIGKSILLQAAASIWADPEPGKYIKSFNSSESGWSQLAVFCCDLPIILDEMQSKQSSVGFDSVVYNLCEGSPRTLSRSAGGTRQQNGWHNMILVNGEQPIVNEFSKPGAQRRVINLHCSGSLFLKGTAMHAEVANFVSENYGTAGREFVDRLLEPGNIDRAANLIAEFKQELGKSEGGMQDLAGSLILAADALAAEWIFEDDVRLSVEDVASLLKTREDVNQNEQVHEYIRQWIRSKQSHFLRPGGKVSGDLYGRIYKRRSGEKVCAILTDRFEQMMGSRRYNPDAYLTWAKANGKISLAKDGNRRPLISFSKRKEDRYHCVCVILDEDAPEGSDIDLASEPHVSPDSPVAPDSSPTSEPAFSADSPVSLDSPGNRDDR